ncbi:hypothetical protein KEM56_001092 [Ascosphaera pollenicola]|nr:hypothetical protein KEM56_001092 [Ascosphaera pollenicola]
MGVVTTGVAYSAGEHSAFMPIAGGFVGHVTRFIEPAMGAAIGWNFSGAMLRTEVIFAMLKILLIIALILGGLIVDLGGGPDHHRTGFRYWRDPGAFNTYLVNRSTGRFLALWSVMLTAAFSYGNIQIVAISGTETKNPRTIIPSATRMTAMRVLVFYIISILIVGMIVASDDPELSNGAKSVKDSP